MTLCWRKFETEEQWKARPRIGDPGYSADDLTLKLDNELRLGKPQDRRVREERLSRRDNVVDLAERRARRRLSER
jgi:hypothetical protein